MESTGNRKIAAGGTAKKLSNKAVKLAGTMLTGCLATLVLSPLGLTAAQAASTQLGDVTITLQSTVGYNLDTRTAPVNNELIGLNTDDGDRNFKSGIFQNRVSTLEQLAVVDGDYGFRASGQAYLDLPYLQNSRNTSPDTFNSYGIGPKGFPSGTVANEGRKLNLLAAFIYGSELFDNGNQRFSWQLGRQTITWGESLFTFNGISSLQAPVDFYQAESVANPEAQQLFLPTGAASLSYDLGNGVTLDAYWQFEYETDILPGVGSYFSSSDITGPGAQRILGSTVSEGAFSIYRAPDVRPSNGLDQFGFAAHDTFGAFGVGAYFVRGIPKAPTVYVNSPAFFTPGPAGLKVGEYNIVYEKPVNAAALSASTLFMQANVAGELSFRSDQPLVSDPFYTSANPANYNDPLYATGNVVNGALSTIYEAPPLPLMPNGASIAAEVDLDEVTGVTARKAAIVPDYTREGGGFEVTFLPNWYPRSDVEIEAPVGWSNTFLGKSEFAGTGAGTGIIDVGIKAVYKSNLTVGANYQRYYGPINFQHSLDRDFLAFYVQRTF